MASGVQNWRFVYKYAVFNLQTSISPYKLAPRFTIQQIEMDRIDDFGKNECHSTLKALDKSTIVYDNISRKEAV
jgi:hypothetical protein